MNKYKKFIKDAYNDKLGLTMCNDWKQKIEKEFPKLFKTTELEIGKWYKRGDGGLWFLTKIENNCSYGYGFDYSREWANESKGYNYTLDLKPATSEEVESALIKEAKRRGFKVGATSKCLNSGTIERITRINFKLHYGGLVSDYDSPDLNSMRIFDNGKWAEIIKETITKEEAEKQLGKTII